MRLEPLALREQGASHSSSEPTLAYTSPGCCPGLHAGSAERAPGWCPRPASRWSRPRCRARSLFPAGSPAAGRRGDTEGQQVPERKPPRQHRGRGGPCHHLPHLSVKSRLREGGTRRTGRNPAPGTCSRWPGQLLGERRGGARDCSTAKQYCTEGQLCPPHRRPGVTASWSR